MKKSYVIVEHRNSVAFNRLKEQVQDLQTKLTMLRQKYRDLERVYGNEVFYNNALCDLLREHDIPFREVFSYEYRKNRYS